MDIMCLFGLFPDEYVDEINKSSVSGVQNAANKLQWGLVRGMDAQEDTCVTICNSLYIGSYPKRYKKMRIPTFPFAHKEGAEDINVGFCNLSGIKYLSRYTSSLKVVKKWAKAETNAQKVLLVYALTVPFVNIAGYIQKKYPAIKVCVVVPDLPEYMNVGAMRKNGAYAFLKRQEIKWLKKCLRPVDYYVLLTEPMKNWFEKPIRYTVVEGITQVQPGEQLPQKEKTVLYAGGIKREYGVIDLVEAFRQVDMPDWQLVIYGDGSDLAEVRRLAQTDARIQIMGAAPNDVVVAHQKRASLLVNPRKNEDFAKYSFPSKILEYMASGTPMLAYKLDGMPEEYDAHYYRISEQENGMRQALADVMALTEENRCAMGTRAREFVAAEKNAKRQCEKIMQMLR